MSWHSQPRERKKGKVGRKPGKEKERGKGKGSGDSREFGSKRKESGASRGQKGPTNGITGGSSGSCRSHAQREKQPGQRLMAVYPQRSRTLETKETTKEESGVTPDGKQTNKEKEKDRRKLLRSPTRVVCRHTRRKRRG